MMRKLIAIGALAMSLTALADKSATQGWVIDKFVPKAADTVEIGPTAYAKYAPSISISPSRTWQAKSEAPFATAIGYDLLVGNNYPVDGQMSYAIGIGTSIKMPYQHDYGLGAQIYAMEKGVMVLGYGASASHPWSTIVGMGRRPQALYTFASTNEANAYLSNSNFVYSTFSAPDSVFQWYAEDTSLEMFIVTNLRSTPNENGWYLDCIAYEVFMDHIPGAHSWKYGKSHGRGTFNIIALGDETTDPGLSGVYINDTSLADLIGVHKGEKTIKPVYNKGIFGPETVICENDRTIAIGDNAMALETAASCQAIAIGRDALSAGSATTAVGPNSFAIGNLSAALGWRANAIGLHSIAIGAAKQSGQNYYSNGVVNVKSDLCQAVGDDSIAIGFNTKAQKNKSIAIGYYAKADAAGAVQIGMGTNSTPNSLQFMNTPIFANGKIVGAFDPKDLDPKEVDVSSPTTADEIEITVHPHIMNTIVSTNECGPGTEIHLMPEGSRNYDLFIPNTPEMRAGLPLTVASEVPGAESIFLNDKHHCFKLPVLVNVQQPHSSVVMFTIREVPDKTDWTPVITECNIVCTNTATVGISPKFVTVGSQALVGTNLHAGVSMKLVYPTSSTATATNELAEVNANLGFMNGTFYGYVGKLPDVVPSGLHINGSTSWFKIVYETVNGKANEITKTIDFE